MSLVDSLQPGTRLLDELRGRERLVREVEREDPDSPNRPPRGVY